MSRPSWDKIFIDILEIIKDRSTCLKIKTAALIVKDTQIISIGYNGTFAKCTECADYWYEKYKQMNSGMSFDEWLLTREFRDGHREWSKSYEIHAESNALSWISKHDNCKYIMYSLYSPCDACAKEIIKYKNVIDRVIYKNKYSRGDDALKRLRDMEIPCYQYII
jgi:dCMP deaminase